MTYPFEARYWGQCIVCDERIEPGDMLVYEADDAIHENCADQCAPEPVQQAARLVCWTVHAGESV